MSHIARFLRSKSGSFAPLTALMIIPIVMSVGLFVDYSAASDEKTRMQTALDAATLTVATMSRTSTDDERQALLESSYEANKGKGTPVLNFANFDADGTLQLSASVSYEKPTAFMGIARINSVNVGADTQIVKKPVLTEATFAIEKVSGYWNKTVTLFGTKSGTTTAKQLMKIDYVFNGAGGAKGYGTTTVLTPDSSGNLTVVNQRQVCTSKKYNSSKPVPSGSFVDGDQVTTCTFTVGNGTGAAIDVSQMESIYLQMDVPAGNPSVLKSNDPNTSNRLYIDGVEVETGQVVDIFTVVPCGQPSSQSWEDGGTPVPAPASNADFYYTVTGKCDFSERTYGTRISQ